MIVTEGELVRWGERIGAQVELPVFLGLRGRLGSGKSVLARAVARGAGVRDTMPSPTFNLLFRYGSEREGDVVHADLYRIEDPDEVWELGWEELGQRNELVLVEWPERAAIYLPPDRWEISLTIPPGRPLLRQVEVTRIGKPPHLPAFPISVDPGGGARP